MRITSEVPPCIPTCFSLASHSSSLSLSSSLQIYLVSFRPSTLDSTSPSRSPPLPAALHFPSPPSLFSLSLFLSSLVFNPLYTDMHLYPVLSLRHRDHSSSRFHPLGRLPFNPLLLPRDSTVSAPSLLHYTPPPRAFSSSLVVAASFRLPTIQPLRALFPSAALPFPDTRHLHPSYLYASYHLRYTSVPPSSPPSPRLSSRANGIQPPNSFPLPPRFQPHLLGEKSRLPICRVIPCLGETRSTKLKRSIEGGELS